MPPDINFITVDTDYSKFSRSENYEKTGIDLSAKHNISESFVLKEKLFYHTHKDEFLSYDDPTYKNLFATSTYDDKLIGFSILPEFYISLKHNFNFSFHYKEDTHKERDRKTDPFTIDKSKTISLGVEHNFFPNEKLKTTIGASYDNFKITKTAKMATKPSFNTFNPMAGINYEINNKHSIFASIAKKTKFPTLKELNGTNGELLDEEVFINYTVGTNYDFNKNIKFNFSLFFHDLKDRISKDGVEYENAGEEEVKGYEASLSLILSKI